MQPMQTAPKLSIRADATLLWSTPSCLNLKSVSQKSNSQLWLGGTSAALYRSTECCDVCLHYHIAHAERIYLHLYLKYRMDAD